MKCRLCFPAGNKGGGGGWWGGGGVQEEVDKIFAVGVRICIIYNGVATISRLLKITGLFCRI